jgi:hypothetical protein
MIVECKVYCSSDSDVNKSEAWLKFAFDSADITGLKEIMDEEDNIVKNECTVFICGNRHTINKSYDEVLSLWKREKNNVFNKSIISNQ